MRVVEDTIVRLLKVKPFYGQFLLQCRRQLLSGSLRSGVTLANGVPVLAVNPQHLALFAPTERQALLEHLVHHLLQQHPGRRRGREPRQWDLACDLAVNCRLDNLPAEAPQAESLRLRPGLAAEEYYQLLPRLPLWGDHCGAGDGEGASEEELVQRQPQPLDNHQVWQQADSTPVALGEQVVRQMVSEALRKCHQQIPAELTPLLQPYLRPGTIPWPMILRQFVGNVGRVGRKSTWKREHRRFGHSHPGIRKQARLNLIVAVDVSESTDQQPLREQFAQELLTIARARQSRIHLLYTNSRVERVTCLDRAPQVTEVFRGGGFTDLRPAFAYARQLQPPPAAMIYLTDGEGEAPEHCPLPTLWVLTNDGRKPADWGQVVRLQPLKEH